MATGTTNPAAGQYPLDSVPDAIVSVPSQCVGAHRCPLFIFFPGAGQPATHITTWLRPVADKFGMILLAPTRYDKETLDAALKEVLRRYAIDPNRIAIIGRCASGTEGLQFGLRNPQIFSRIATISGGTYAAGLEGANPKAQILIDLGLNEFDGEMLNGIHQLRQNGRPVTALVTLRGHEDQTEDYEFLGRWLRDSWARPASAPPPPPAVIANPLPLLTVDALKHMTDFWTSFSHEPDSIRITARQNFLHEVAVPLGKENISTFITDMSALAEHYPSVANDLKQAGLTAHEHDAYRIALINARVTNISQENARARHVPDTVITVEPNSVIAQNVAFYKGHLDELLALSRAGMEHPEKLEGLGGNIPARKSVWRPSPEAVKGYGAMGIWRMP